MAEALIKYKPTVKGRAQLGVQAFADALLIIPKVWIPVSFLNYAKMIQLMKTFW